MVGEVREKFHMANLTVPNNLYPMKYSVKSISGLAHVGVLIGDGDGPRAQSRYQGGLEKVLND